MTKANISPVIHHYFDKNSNTFSYLVICSESKSCAIIDPVLDFDYASGTTCSTGVDQIIEVIRTNDLTLEWIIETHVHADHLSSAPYIQERLGGKLGIGEHIITVQDTFGKIYNEGSEFQRDGSQFDHLFTDNEEYKIGNIPCKAMHTPGHTPACMTHLIGDAAFVGDTLFMPDSGSARADFPGGDAGTLYRSIQRILSLPSTTRLFMCHDYAPNGRELLFETTVAEQRASNIHVNDAVEEDEYIKLREARDAQLAMPKLILPSLQVNMKAGEFPAAEDNDQIYLKIPINAFK